MKDHVVIKELLNRGHTPVFKQNSVGVEGFYKAGEILLSLSPQNPEVLIYTHRYGDEEEVRTFDDLVRIHFMWWKRSRNRAEQWSQPEKQWVEDYIRLDFIEIQVVTLYYPKD